MHTPFQSACAAGVAHATSMRPIHASLLALLCAGLWCGTPQAAPEPGNLNPAATAPVMPQDKPPLSSATAGGPRVDHSSGASTRRLAIGGVVAWGLWQAWRAQHAEAGARTGTPAAAAPATLIDPDRPIAMDGVTSVAELQDYSVRRLMDSLRELRANKRYDCDHGKTAQEFFCAKIRLVKAALGLHGVAEFGDESNDACECR